MNPVYYSNQKKRTAPGIEPGAWRLATTTLPRTLFEHRMEPLALQMPANSHNCLQMHTHATNAYTRLQMTYTRYTRYKWPTHAYNWCPLRVSWLRCLNYNFWVFERASYHYKLEKAVGRPT